MTRLISICFGFLLFASCSNRRLSEEKAVYEKQLKQFNFKLSAVDPETLVKINYKNQDLSKEETKKIMDEYKDYLCFRFEIKVDGFSEEITQYYDKYDNKADYDKLINYYLFEMQNDLYLVGDNSEKIPCSIYFFERNYDLTKSNRFMLVFKKFETKGKVTFTYDNKYLNIGKVNFLI